MNAVLAALVLIPLCALSPGQTAPATPAANPADVKSIDSIIAAVYEVLSGPAGEQRDWQRFRSLFYPGARLTPTAALAEGGHGGRMLSVEEYVERTQPLLAHEAFYEDEIARRTEQWGHIAQVFSTYASRRSKGQRPFARGINSMQLMNDGQRWWLLSIIWEKEGPEQPLPRKYLKSARQ